MSHADIPHRTEGEGVLVELLPERVERVLDLGCGDGRLLGIVHEARPESLGVGLDFSAPVLATARELFAEDGALQFMHHDLAEPLPDLGRFGVVVSSFAIHHLEHARKRRLYGEVFSLLEPGGVFCNLEQVSSPTEALHREFLSLLGLRDDPSRKLLDVETQVGWLRELGFDDADCLWKWRELALLLGRR